MVIMLRRIIVVTGVFAALAFADSINLKNGSTIEGTYVGGDARTVKVMVGNQVQTYRVGQVSSIVFGDNGDQTSDAAPPPQGAPPPPDNSGLQTQRAYDQPNPAAAGLTIPAGTPLVVRMIDRVDSEVDRTGQTFRASVDEPVLVNGQEIVPRGADAVVKLVASQQSGKFEGRTALTLALQQVMINGRMVDTY